MKARFLLGCSFFLMTLLFGTSLVLAQGVSSCNVATIFNGWAAASPAGAPNGVAYGLIANLSDQPDTLLSVSTDAAETAELHQMSVGAGDVMQMMPVEGGIPIAAQSFQELKQGGFHIMLINLKKALMAGKSLNLTLTFERAGEVKVVVPIVDANAATNMGSEMTKEPSTGSTSMMATATAPAAMTSWPEGCAKMHVLGAWARPAGPGMPNSAAYALLVNLTGADDTLLSANTTASSTVELHEMKMGSGDVMQMSPIEGGVVIPSGGAVILQPGGKHIMLIGLTQELVAGTTLDFTLKFAQAGELKISVPVQPPPDNGMPMQATPTASGG